MSTPAAAATATYLYCLVRHSQPLEVSDAPEGLPGAGPPRLLTATTNLWLVVADVPLPEYSAEAVEARLQDLSWVSARAVAHESVVEHFLEVESLVPLKLFTLFSSDEQALSYLRQHQHRLEGLLDRVSRHREWGVRVRLVLEKSTPASVSASGSPAASGREFLLRKRQRRMDAQAAVADARQRVGEAWEELRRVASQARLRPPLAPELENRMLLEASFLVAESEAETFESVVARWADRLAEARCELTLTGPWPPYSFVAEAQ